MSKDSRAEHRTAPGYHPAWSRWRMRSRVSVTGDSGRQMWCELEADLRPDAAVPEGSRR